MRASFRRTTNKRRARNRRQCCNLSQARRPLRLVSTGRPAQLTSRCVRLARRRAMGRERQSTSALSPPVASTFVSRRPPRGPAAPSPRVLGGTNARAMTAALAWLLPPAPGAAAAAAARRRNNAALRERALVGAIAGAMAGAFVNGLLHPLDTIKVQLQLRGSTLRGPRAVVAASFAAHGRAGGLARLYAGAPLAVIGSGASSALYFGAYDAAKAAGVPPPIAALMGNAVSSLILVPKEVLKSRLQAGAPGGAMGVAAAALRSGGVRSLYAGYVPTLMRNAPSNVISFSTYEGLKALAQRQLARHSGTCAEAGAPLPPLPAPLAACAGACSGALAAVLTHPLDLVKTRLQTQGVGGRPPAGLALYAGVGPTLRAVVATEGPRGLSRGLTTRLAYNALFSSLGFAAFETAKRAIAAARPPPPPLEEDEGRSSA